MAQLKMSFEQLDKIIDRGEVDTLSLMLNVKKWVPSDDERQYILNQIKKVSVLERKEIAKKVNGEEEILQDYYYNSSIRNEIDKKITRYGFSYRCLTSYLTITLKHTEVLGQNEDSIIENLKKEMSKHFDIEIQYLNNIGDYICLGRVDYKRDYRFHNLEEYCLIKQIIEIASMSIGRGYYCKTNKAETELAYLMKYQSKSNKTVEFAIYDKHKERVQDYIENNISICTEEEYAEDYLNTIRFEVRIQNAKLNALKYQGVSKDILSYKNREMAETLFNCYAEQAFFTEPFYRKDIAKRLINKSDLKSNMKTKCCEVIEDINANGFSYARNKYSTIGSNKGKEVRRYDKFNRYISTIRGLGINPLTLDTNWKDRKAESHKTTYQMIPNFISADNCRKEEAVMPY